MANAWESAPVVNADPPDLSGQYNTQLTPREESQYQSWAKANKRDRDTYDYDMRGAWKEMQAGGAGQAANGHFTDKYKKPNHPTFSDQSMYNGTDGYQGGKWSQAPDGRDVFVPSQSNLKNMSADQLKQYFAKVEPNAQLQIDAPISAAKQPAWASAPTVAQPAPQEQAAAPQGEQSSMMGDAKQMAGNVVAGAVRGAGSIGATILTPYDLAVGNTESIGNPERRQAMTDALQTMGADPSSMAFKGGKLAGEIAGTAGAPGAIAKGAAAVGAPAALTELIASGGFKLAAPKATTAIGNAAQWLARIGTGAAVGGAQAGLVNPEDAGTGAAIGGALPPAAKVAGEAGKLLNRGASWFISNSLGGLTGTSAEAVKAAYQSGKRGATEFLDNMRGKADFDEIVTSAKQGLSNMREARANAYRSGMVDIKADKSVLDFAGVDKALGNVVSTGSFKGVPIRQKAAETVDEVKQVIETWRGLDPAQYHTPEGFDALKQAVGDIRDSTQFGTPARRAADSVYNAVKTEINKQAPTYAKVMRDYEMASRELKEVEKTFSLGEKSSADTAVRKLQSLLRNNVQSNYGNRTSLAKQLEEKGGVSLEPAIAGQALNSWMPRGMTGAIEKAGAIPTAMLAPQALAVAPLTSPRLVGEASYLLGRASGGVGNAASQSNALLNLSPQQRISMMNALLRTPAVIGLADQVNRQ